MQAARVCEKSRRKLSASSPAYEDRTDPHVRKLGRCGVSGGRCGCGRGFDTDESQWENSWLTEGGKTGRRVGNKQMGNDVSGIGDRLVESVRCWKVFECSCDKTHSKC